MTPRFVPQLDDEVAEAVGDRCVLGEAWFAVDVAAGAKPVGHPIELSEFALEGSGIERAVMRAAW
jgi:hypothetical protein